MFTRDYHMRELGVKFSHATVSLMPGIWRSPQCSRASTDELQYGYHGPASPSGFCISNHRTSNVALQPGPSPVTKFAALSLRPVPRNRGSKDICILWLNYPICVIEDF